MSESDESTGSGRELRRTIKALRREIERLEFGDRSREREREYDDCDDRRDDISRLQRQVNRLRHELSHEERLMEELDDLKQELLEWREIERAEARERRDEQALWHEVRRLGDELEEWRECQRSDDEIRWQEQLLAELRMVRYLL
ncbi:MAG TPA: hypothetical protein VF898_01255, partial [Chloroflexota bacterium]